jgi:hypothetical protein
MPRLCFPWFLLLLPQIGFANAKGKSCGVNELPIVVLSKNPETGKFSLVHRGIRDPDLDLDDRKLQTLNDQDIQESLGDGYRNGLRRGFFPGLLSETKEEVSLRRLEKISGEGMGDLNESLYYARECGCFESSYRTVFCPLTVQSCISPSTRNSSQLPQCLTESKDHKFATVFWFVVVAWFTVLLSFCMCTFWGSAFFDYLLSCLFPSWNQHVVTRMMQNNPRMTNRLIENHLQRRRRILERLEVDADASSARVIAQAIQELDGVADNESPKDEPASLVLRTKIYRHDCGSIKCQRSLENVEPTVEEEGPTVEEGHDQDDSSCTICFVPLLDGDRIGALPCNHLFHADCLKSWLRRRNVCPLCQAQDVATPQFDKSAEPQIEPAETSTDSSEPSL